jgi:sulfate adenylyltransferase subunit 1
MTVPDPATGSAALQALAAADVLRVATAGSVDDGKSTLIGRLLHDTKSVLADQLEAVARTSTARGDETLDLSLLTDGLKAEREQGITIDVAYRYFATARRSFVLADTPGHVQYTRNMVTGASTADVALVLVDARHGVVEQTRRHVVLAALLRVPHLVVVVNKIDLVEFDQAVFERIVADLREFSARLDVGDLRAVPVAALHGDNVVDRSDRTPWYDGPALLQLLEELPPGDRRGDAPWRMPVQLVVRPRTSTHPDYRGYAGRIAAGTVAPGDEVVVLPSGRRSTVEAVETADGELPAAGPQQSVVVRLTDDIDISRGDVLAGAAVPPRVARDLDAAVAWMTDEPLVPGARLLLKSATRTTRAIVKSLDSRLDVVSLAHVPGPSELGLNEIGRVTIRTADPLAVDDYADDRTTGSFLLVDELTSATVGAGMIGPDPVHDAGQSTSPAATPA